MNSDFEETGAALQRRSFSKSEMEMLSKLGNTVDTKQPGRRLQGNAIIRKLTAPGLTLRSIAQGIIGEKARAVRAALFNKTADNNWPLGWHQDRTICVLKRAQINGFGPFTTKSGLLHVQPPPEVIANLVTLRAHLDPCRADNAPLKVAMGSHRQGFNPIDNVSSVVANSQTMLCLANPGDVWAYRTLILHASDISEKPSQRRVLQVDFSAQDLPSPLEWSGI